MNDNNGQRGRRTTWMQPPKRSAVIPYTEVAKMVLGKCAAPTQAVVGRSRVSGIGAGGNALFGPLRSIAIVFAVY